MRDIFVARQPIFDAAHRVAGYELLYRAHAHAETAAGPAVSGMSSSVIVDGVLGIGLDTLTEGQTAFINISEPMLLDGAAEILDPESVVIELLESVRPRPEVLFECRTLVDKGFRLALDDFRFDDDYAPLLDLVEVVKVDVIESEGRLQETVEKLRPFGVRLLAEKVESQGVHAACVDLGFELFQGFHYFRPEILTKRDLSTESVAIIRILNLIQDPGVTDRTIEEAFRCDPSLTYKLLRIVNSASLGGRGVQSIAHALRLLGRDPLYRWLSLLLVSAGTGIGDLRLELIKAALIRGRMCELVGERARSAGHGTVPPKGALFLVGLFSFLDRLLGVSLKEILDDIDVAEDVTAALLERAGVAGTILTAVEAYTDGFWDRAEHDLAGIGAHVGSVSEIFLDSLGWAGARMAFHRDDDQEPVGRLEGPREPAPPLPGARPQPGPRSRGRDGERVPATPEDS